LIDRLSLNGVETLNVVREGDITDTDIADAERFVDWWHQWSRDRWRHCACPFQERPNITVKL